MSEIASISTAIKPYFATCQTYSCAPEEGPRGMLSQLWGLTEPGATVYLVKPALNVFENSRPVANAETILDYWCNTLKSMASRGEQGLVAGVPLSCIPSGEAYIWGYNVPLEAMQKHSVNLAQSGIHCIVIPPDSSLKRHLQSESKSSQKRQKESQLPASTSNETAIADSDIRNRIQERADALLASIDLLKANNNIHDPHNTTPIPFPTLHSSNVKWARNFHRESGKDTASFAYKGRTILPHKILPIVRSLYENPGSATVGFFGTRGAGRSHITTAAASLLLSEGLPVVFLAFLGTTPRTAIIRDAFVLALRRRRDLWQYTDLLFNYCCKYPDSRTGIIKFSDYLQTKGIKLLFVVLKMDSLNQQELDDFRRMSSGHILCFTADGNSALRENLEIQVAGGYKDVVCINLNGGLEEDELCGWLSQHETESKVKIKDEERELIELTTGNVPFLLSMLLTAVRDKGSFHKKQLQLAVDVYSELSAYLRELMKQSPAYASDMHKLLLAAMNNNSSDIIPSFTDRRFIFKNEDGRWRCTSIFAYEAIYRFAITIQDGIRFFEAKHWRDCIPVVGHNPSMLGYAIEYALTNELRHGLALPGRLRIPQLPLFALPSGGRPRTIKESGLYVPMEFNHRYIDCVAVWFDGNNAHIVPIQITNVKKKSDHSNSEEKFFGDSEDWKLWQEAVTKPKRKIHWDFLWILNCKEAAMETRRACNGGPARRVFTTGFKSVSKEVDEALKAL